MGNHRANQYLHSNYRLLPHRLLTAYNLAYNKPAIRPVGAGARKGYDNRVCFLIERAEVEIG
jgi:hypothetical protein